MTVTIPFRQMAFPVRTVERVPIEDMQVWAQFAEVAAIPEAFRIVAEALFALSWELRANEYAQCFESEKEGRPEIAVGWLDLVVSDLKYAIGDWHDVLRVLHPVAQRDEQRESMHWVRVAQTHIEQDEALMRQVCRYATLFCQHYQVPLPADIHKQVYEAQVQAQVAAQLQP